MTIVAFLLHVWLQLVVYSRQHLCWYGLANVLWLYALSYLTTDVHHVVLGALAPAIPVIFTVETIVETIALLVFKTKKFAKLNNFINLNSKHTALLVRNTGQTANGDGVSTDVFATELKPAASFAFPTCFVAALSLASVSALATFFSSAASSFATSSALVFAASACTASIFAFSAASGGHIKCMLRRNGHHWILCFPAHVPWNQNQSEALEIFETYGKQLADDLSALFNMPITVLIGGDFNNSRVTNSKYAITAQIGEAQSRSPNKTVTGILGFHSGALTHESAGVCARYSTNRNMSSLWSFHGRQNCKEAIASAMTEQFRRTLVQHGKRNNRAKKKLERQAQRGAFLNLPNPAHSIPIDKSKPPFEPWLSIPTDSSTRFTLFDWLLVICLESMNGCDHPIHIVQIGGHHFTTHTTMGYGPKGFNYAPNYSFLCRGVLQMVEKQTGFPIMTKTAMREMFDRLSEKLEQIPPEKILEVQWKKWDEVVSSYMSLAPPVRG